MMPIDVISEESYYDFANRFFQAAGRRLDRSVFSQLYRRFEGITWYMQAFLWDFYASGSDIADVSQLDDAVRQRIAANEYDQQRLLEILPPGARRLLRAVAMEGCVKAPQSGAFVAKYGLRAASSVRTALEMLVEKELIYPGRDGYVVYDRLFAEWLRAR